MEHQQNLINFVSLSKRRDVIEEELKVLKEELAHLSNMILEVFERDGQKSATIMGKTIYIRRQLWARAKDKNYVAACAALKKCGLEGYVEERFNTNSISAYVRERDKANEPLPKELQDTLEISTEVSVICKQA